MDQSNVQCDEIRTGAPSRVKELPHELRPREEFQRIGAQQVQLDILIAILIRTGVPGRNVVEVAREIVSRFNGIHGLVDASYEQLRNARIKGMGKVKCMELAAALEIGRRAMSSLNQRDYRQEEPPLNTPEVVYEYLRPYVRGLQQEVFLVILLNSKNRPIGKPIEVTRGLVDTTPVHPREIFANAVKNHAAAIILAHNHPSGDPTPSPEDLAVTRRMIDAAYIVGIKVLDHIILGVPSAKSSGYVSIRSKDLVPFK